MTTEVVDARVERAERALDAEPAEERPRALQQRPGGAGEEEEDQDERAEDERALQPEVGVDVVGPDREEEADRTEEDRARAAEAALQQDDRRDVRRPAAVAPRRLVDAHCVAADRGREHLARRVRDEVRAGEPPEGVVHPLRAHQPLPAAAPSAARCRP